MKILAILSAFLVSISSSSGQTPNPGLIISHLTGDFYVYTTFGLYKGNPVPSNSMYLVTSDAVVLFDTPWDSTQFKPLLDSIKIRHGKKVIMCISTHFHEDRTAGLEYYKSIGIRTYTTKRTDELSKERNEKRAEFLMYKDSLFTVGQYSFQTYYGGQGHSPDNIVIWFEKEKILYGGCLVKSTEAEDLGNLSDANVENWVVTIKNIQHKFRNPEYIIPGHLDWSSKESLTHTLDLIQQYQKRNHQQNKPMILKQLLPATLLFVSLLSCNNESKSLNDKNDSSTVVTDTLAYPFTASYSLKWQPGDEKNALLVLNCLKKYVDGDIAGSVAYFADTAEFVADKFYFKGGRDSLTKIIADMRNASATVSKNFETWSTIFYPDKNETWVTLWYTEIMTDKKGKVDSIYYTDDVLVKNNQIVVYDEKQRQFPSPKLK